jgi:hypothetical protein
VFIPKGGKKLEQELDLEIIEVGTIEEVIHLIFK